MSPDRIRPIHVLLVDDDDDEFVVLRDILSESIDNRYKLEWVGTFEAALATLQTRPFDVCLVDYRLGKHTGVELIKEATHLGIRIPMILLTGYADKETSQAAIKLGAADYLTKSEISSSLLDRSILYAIHRTQMRAQSVSQDRMASIGMLASSLAHEIGTPLGVIRGRSEYLGNQVAKDPAIKKNVDVIISQIDRVSHLIRALLNVARGDTDEALTSVSVNQSVSDVVDLMDHEFRKAEIRFENQLPAGVNVVGQRLKLHQVLLNLIVNAVHALAKGDPKPEGRLIKVSADDLGPHWLIKIHDNGSGISKDNIPNLFRPFFTTKSDGVGTGLGLATSLWIVEAWAGSMEIESEEGVGTTVNIQIPKAT